MFTQSFLNTLITVRPDWPHGSSVQWGSARRWGNVCIYQPCAYATTLTVPPRLSTDLFFFSSPYSSTQFLYNLIKNVFKHFCCSGCSVALATKFTHYYEVPEAWSWAGTILLNFFFPLLSFHLAILFAVPIQQTTQRRLYFINKSYRVFFSQPKFIGVVEYNRGRSNIATLGCACRAVFRLWPLVGCGRAEGRRWEFPSCSGNR